MSVQRAIQEAKILVIDHGHDEGTTPTHGMYSWIQASQANTLYYIGISGLAERRMDNWEALHICDNLTRLQGSCRLHGWNTIPQLSANKRSYKEALIPLHRIYVELPKFMQGRGDCCKAIEGLLLSS